MTSLAEVYEGKRGPDLRRLYAGVGLFGTGVVLLAAAILLAGTDLLGGAGLGLYEARRIAGVLGGLGLPAVFLGVLTVLPASRGTRAAAVIGASVAVLGVGLFWHAYPCRWIGATCGPPVDLTLPTVGVYFLGAVTTFWCLFVGVANVKTRNDPGGTVTLERIRAGDTRIVEVERPSLGIGGMGFLGSTPGGDVSTQTGAASAGSGGGPGSGAGGVAGGAAVEDGGESGDDITSPLDGGGGASGGDPHAAVIGEEPVEAAADKYCGNCSAFEYVRTDEGIRPYCTHHAELMDDMDACEEWRPR